MRVPVRLLAALALAGCRREAEISLIPPDFFEDGKPTANPADAGQPSDSFPEAQARFVHGHLRATYPRLRSNRVLPSSCELIDTMRTTLVKMAGDVTFEAGTERTEWFVTFGKPTPGSWKPGHYRVACKVGPQWTSASFDVVASAP